jgi:GNAT superfamily N-acetyltransferase
MMITADQPLDEQFQRTIAAAPHVLVVEAEVLSADVCGIFTDFTGGLLVVETSQLAFGKRCLCDLRINSRWRLVEQKSLVCEPCKVLLEDVRFDEDEEAATSEGTPLAGLTDVMKEQFGPLYIEEFGLGSLSPFGNLKRTQDGYGLRLSFLVTPAQDEDDVPELLGFLAYKSWGGRKPGVSIAATAVPDIHQRKGLGRLLMSVAQAKAAAAGYGQEKPGCVFLRSLPTAVGFYLRIGARAFHHDGSEVLDVEAIDTDEDAPCVPMELECPPVDRPCWPAVDENTHEPWSPRRAAHLEDGPTWLPLESLLALPMAGA